MSLGAKLTLWLLIPLLGVLLALGHPHDAS